MSGLEQLEENLRHAREQTAQNISTALQILQESQQPQLKQLSAINQQINKLSQQKPRTNKNKIKKQKNIEKLKQRKPKIKRTSDDIKYYNNVLRIQSTPEYINMYFNNRDYILDTLTPYVDDNNKISHTYDNIYYQPVNNILDPAFHIPVPNKSHMRIQFIAIQNYELSFDDINNHTLSPDVKHILGIHPDEDYNKKKAAFYTSRLAHYALSYSFQQAKKKATNDLEEFVNSHPPSHPTYQCALDTFYTTTTSTTTELINNPTRSFQENLKHRIIQFLDRRRSPDPTDSPMLICIESITSTGQPTPQITSDDIKGATSTTDLHCINNILQSYNLPLLPLVQGQLISIQALELLVKKSKHYRFNVHNRLTALLDLEPMFTLGGTRSKQIDITHQFCHFTTRKLTTTKNKQIDEIQYTTQITQDPDAIDIIKAGCLIVGQYILDQDKLIIQKTYNPFQSPPSDPEHMKYATCFTRHQYIFRKFLAENNIMPSQFDLPQLADYHSPMERYQKPQTTVFEYDLNNAYPSTISPDHLYPMHTLIVQNTTQYSPNIAFVINPIIHHTDQNLLNIFNMYYRSPIIGKPVLDFLIKNNFQVNFSQVIITTNHRPLKGFPLATKQEKRIILGKLIQKQSSTVKVFSECNLDEYKSLQYTASTNNISAYPYEWNAPANALQDLTVELPKNKKTYAYIHATMLSHHHVNMLTALFQFNRNEIIEVYVDAIFVTKPLINDKFKAVTKSKQFHQDKIAIGYPSNTPEPYPTYNLPEQPIPIDSRIMAISGPAGSGKSYGWLNFLQNTPNTMLLTPTVQLRTAHRNSLPDTHQNKVQTAAKVFQFSMTEQQYNLSACKRPKHQNIYIIDEFTMFSSNEFNQILRRSESFIILLGDVHQISKSIDSAPIMTHPEFPPVHEHKSHAFRRQTDPEFISFLDTIRTMPYQSIIKEINKLSWNRGLSTELQYILADNHKVLAPFNAQHLKDSKLVQIRSKKEKSIIQMTQADISRLPKAKKPVILQQARSKPNPYEVAFGCTVDSFQGSTMTKPYGIILSDMHRDGALYTALSRARDRSQIWLL